MSVEFDVRTQSLSVRNDVIPPAFLLSITVDSVDFMSAFRVFLIRFLLRSIDANGKMFYNVFEASNDTACSGNKSK